MTRDQWMQRRVEVCHALTKGGEYSTSILAIAREAMVKAYGECPAEPAPEPVQIGGTKVYHSHGCTRVETASALGIVIRSYDVDEVDELIDALMAQAAYQRRLKAGEV